MNDDARKKRTAETLNAELQAVSSVFEAINENFFSAVKLIGERRGKIVTTGVGKSGFIAMKAAATLTSLGQESVFLSPLDALHGDSGIVKNEDVLIVFSFSGSSPELVKLIRHLRLHVHINVIGVTGNAESQIAQLSDTIITFRIESEGCPLGLAPMASTTASLVIADCLASALTSPEEFNKEHFAQFHPAGSLGLTLKKVSEVMAGGELIPLIKEGALLGEALVEITLKKRGIVAVVDDVGSLVGVITDGDLRRSMLEHDNPKNKLVETVMTKDPKVVHESDDLKYTLTVMRQHQILNVFVVDSKNTLVGLVHMHDIVGDFIPL